MQAAAWCPTQPGRLLAPGLKRRPPGPLFSWWSCDHPCKAWQVAPWGSDLHRLPAGVRTGEGCATAVPRKAHALPGLTAQLLSVLPPPRPARARQVLMSVDPYFPHGPLFSSCPRLGKGIGQSSGIDSGGGVLPQGVPTLASCESTPGTQRGGEGWPAGFLASVTHARAPSMQARVLGGRARPSFTSWGRALDRPEARR